MGRTIAELLVEIGVSVDGAKKAEREINDVRRDVDRMGDTSQRATNKASRGFRQFGARVRATTKRVRASAAQLRKSLGGVVRVVAAVTAAVTGGGAAVFRFVQAQTAAIDQNNKLAEATGLATEEFQRLNFAASQSGASKEQLSAAVRRLNTNLLDMASGGGQMASDALDSIGLSLADFDGLTTRQQLGIIGDALNTVEDQGERTAISARIFGEEAGPKLANLLSQGSAGINQLADSARILTEDQAKQATEFQDLLGETRGEISAVFQSLAVELIPVTKEVINTFREWLAENEDLIKQNLPKLIETLIPLLSNLLDQVSEFLRLFGATRDLLVQVDEELTQRFGPAWEGFKNLMASALNPAQAIGNALQVIVDLLEKVGIELPALQNAADFLTSRGLLATTSSGGVDDDTAGAAGRVLGQVLSLSRDGGFDNAVADFQATRADLQQKQREDRFEFLEAKRVARRLSQSEAEELVREFDVSRPAASQGIRRIRGMKKSGKGGGGSSAKDKDVVSDVTFEDVFAALLTGRGSDLAQNVSKLAGKTPSSKAIKPTVAIDFFNFEVNQTITGQTDARAIGRESAKAIRDEFRKSTAKAATSVQGNTLR